VELDIQTRDIYRRNYREQPYGIENHELSMRWLYLTMKMVCIGWVQINIIVNDIRKARIRLKNIGRYCYLSKFGCGIQTVLLKKKIVLFRGQALRFFILLFLNWFSIAGIDEDGHESVATLETEKKKVVKRRICDSEYQKKPF
jgi:hypothetical protein